MLFTGYSALTEMMMGGFLSLELYQLYALFALVPDWVPLKSCSSPQHDGGSRQHMIRKRSKRRMTRHDYADLVMRLILQLILLFLSLRLGMQFFDQLSYVYEDMNHAHARMSNHLLELRKLSGEELERMLTKDTTFSARNEAYHRDIEFTSKDPHGIAMQRLVDSWDSCIIAPCDTLLINVLNSWSAIFSLAGGTVVVLMLCMRGAGSAESFMRARIVAMDQEAFARTRREATQIHRLKAGAVDFTPLRLEDSRVRLKRSASTSSLVSSRRKGHH